MLFVICFQWDCDIAHSPGLVWLVCSLLLFIDIWESLDVVVVITLYFLNGFMELDLAGFMLGLVFFPRGADLELPGMGS